MVLLLLIILHTTNLLETCARAITKQKVTYLLSQATTLSTIAKQYKKFDLNFLLMQISFLCKFLMSERNNLRLQIAAIITFMYFKSKTTKLT